MAQQGIQSDQEKHCSMCFDPLKDPEAIPCGHTYCKSCIKSHSDEDNTKDLKGTHGCPQCGQVSISTPASVKNTMFADLEEEPKRTGLQTAAGAAEVCCGVTGAVSDKPQESLNEDQPKTSEDEPRTRADFLKYSCEITLDPNTANPCLLLSEGNRKATKMDEDQVYPSHPDRFVDGALVLSKESLTGRHYWEVERSGGAVSVAVTYKNISRMGTESVFGCNDKSWALDCFDSRYVVRHTYIIGAKPHPMSSRVGVYLDHRAGLLSFYSVSETMTLLHTVQTTFTGPLYAGLWVHGHNSSAVVGCEASS